MKIRLCAVTAAVVASMVAAGCGSSGTSSSTASSGTSSSGSDIAAQAAAEMKKLYAGTYTLPEGASPTPAKNKKIWIVSLGQGAPAMVDMANGMNQAAKALGWKTATYDGKFQPNLWLAGIRQGIAARADGIWLDNIDCKPVIAALKDAKAAGIPVVINEGHACPSKDADLAAYVASYNTKYDKGMISKGPGSFDDLNRAWGATGAWNIVAKTKGKAQVLNFVETDNASTLDIGQGVEDVVARCPSCKVLDKVTFVGTDLGPALQQKAQQALLQHPTANAVHGNYDGAITSGIAAALASLSKRPLLFGVEGFPANAKLTRQGVQTGGGGFDGYWDGWCGADEFVYVFAGKTPRSCGVGVKAWDKNHNLPAPGKTFTGGLDYPAAYKKSWGIG
jgi:ribose transport system substrate-binding protein